MQRNKDIIRDDTQWLIIKICYNYTIIMLYYIYQVHPMSRRHSGESRPLAPWPGVQIRVSQPFYTLPFSNFRLYMMSHSCDTQAVHTPKLKNGSLPPAASCLVTSFHCPGRAMPQDFSQNLAYSKLLWSQPVKSGNTFLQYHVIWLGSTISS